MLFASGEATLANDFFQGRVVSRLKFFYFAGTCISTSSVSSGAIRHRARVPSLTGLTGKWQESQKGEICKSQFLSSDKISKNFSMF